MARRRRRRRTAASRHRPVVEFARGLGYRFRDIGLLEEALTHGSYRNSHEVPDYERLEFLGDAALGLVVTESLHGQRPGWDPQRRQETKSDLVSNQSLAEAARSLSLDEGIRVGSGGREGEAVRSSDRILANVFEAVLGAAYLDGGMPAARGVFGTAFRERVRRLRLDPPEGEIEPPLDRAAEGLRSAGRRAWRAARRLALLSSPSERALGYTFARPAILREALQTDGEPKGRRGKKRRRRGRRGAGTGGEASAAARPALRFLGRDVLHLVLAETLHRHFPEWDEGRLTLARMRLQGRDFTRRLSRHWSLGNGDEAAGSAEALMGALYLDGGLDATRRALGQPFTDALEELRNPELELLDPKTLLQNRLAQAGKEAPRYEIRRSTGRSGNDGRISVVVRLEDGISETGVGRGLKEAEKDAAQRVLDRLAGRKGRRGGRKRRAAGTSREDGGQQRGGRESGDRESAGRERGSRQEKAPPTAEAADNPKGALQEALVKKEGRLPVYRLLSESGPEHEKTYVVEVLAGRRALGRGVGSSKRKAEAEAAAAALAGGI